MSSKEVIVLTRAEPFEPKPLTDVHWSRIWPKKRLNLIKPDAEVNPLADIDLKTTSIELKTALTNGVISATNTLRELAENTIGLAALNPALTTEVVALKAGRVAKKVRQEVEDTFIAMAKEFRRNPVRTIFKLAAPPFLALQLASCNFSPFPSEPTPVVTTLPSGTPDMAKTRLPTKPTETKPVVTPTKTKEGKPTVTPPPGYNYSYSYEDVDGTIYYFYSKDLKEWEVQLITPTPSSTPTPTPKSNEGFTVQVDGSGQSKNAPEISEDKVIDKSQIVDVKEVSLDFSFLALKQRFSENERIAITQGVKEAEAFWRNNGVKTDSLTSVDLIVVAEENHNSAYFSNGAARIDILDRQKKVAAHEASHIFGIAVKGKPGFREGFALFTQIILYGGSAASNEPVTNESLGNFSCVGGGFDGQNYKERVQNYNRTAEAAKQLGLNFWVFVANKYHKWLLDNNMPPMSEVPEDTFRGWTEELKPGLWEEMQNKYPVLFCS